MTDFAHNPSSTTILDVNLPLYSEPDGGAAVGRGAHRLARIAAVTVGLLGLCALSLWVGALAIEGGEAAGQWLTGEVRGWLLELQRGLVAMGAS